MARLLPPESASASALSREIGVSEATLERWLSQALAEPAPERVWTAAARFDAVLTTASMDEATRSAWCRSNGVYPQVLRGPSRAWPRPASIVAVAGRTSRIVGGFASSSASCNARRRRWPRQRRYWCYQKARGDLQQGRGRMIFLEDRRSLVADSEQAWRAGARLQHPLCHGGDQCAYLATLEGDRWPGGRRPPGGGGTPPPGAQL